MARLPAIVWPQEDKRQPGATPDLEGILCLPEFTARQKKVPFAVANDLRIRLVLTIFHSVGAFVLYADKAMDLRQVKQLYASSQHIVHLEHSIILSSRFGPLKSEVTCGQLAKAFKYHCHPDLDRLDATEPLRVYVSLMCFAPFPSRLDSPSELRNQHVAEGQTMVEDSSHQGDGNGAEKLPIEAFPQGNTSDVSPSPRQRREEAEEEEGSAQGTIRAASIPLAEIEAARDMESIARSDLVERWVQCVPPLHPYTSLTGLARGRYGKCKTACSVCRRQNRKCDEKQPRCTRCVKANLQCGYKNADTEKTISQHKPRTPLPRVVWPDDATDWYPYHNPDSKEWISSHVSFRGRKFPFAMVENPTIRMFITSWTPALKPFILYTTADMTFAQVRALYASSQDVMPEHVFDLGFAAFAPFDYRQIDSCMTCGQYADYLDYKQKREIDALDMEPPLRVSVFWQEQIHEMPGYIPPLPLRASRSRAASVTTKFPADLPHPDGPDSDLNRKRPRSSTAVSDDGQCASTNEHPARRITRSMAAKHASDMQEALGSGAGPSTMQ